MQNEDARSNYAIRGRIGLNLRTFQTKTDFFKEENFWKLAKNSIELGLTIVWYDLRCIPVDWVRSNSVLLFSAFLHAWIENT